MNCRCLPLINMLVPCVLSGTNQLFRAVKETRRGIKKNLMFFILEETDWFLVSYCSNFKASHDSQACIEGVSIV